MVEALLTVRGKIEHLPPGSGIDEHGAAGEFVAGSLVGFRLLARLAVEALDAAMAGRAGAVIIQQIRDDIHPREGEHRSHGMHIRDEQAHGAKLFFGAKCLGLRNRRQSEIPDGYPHRKRRSGRLVAIGG